MKSFLLEKTWSVRLGVLLKPKQELTTRPLQVTYLSGGEKRKKNKNKK
jgi:hypothetical protein